MAKCQACKAAITWAVNTDTNKKVPLVPFDPAYPKAIRYKLRQGRDSPICCRDAAGEMMSHFANCPGANRFSGRKAKPDPDLSGKNSDPGDQA